jgi:hypothetical protein
MMALLALDHQDLVGVIRARELTQAAMLAQMTMTETELLRYPNDGKTRGNFSQTMPGQYANFRWERLVSESGIFPDLRKVTVTVFFGPGFSRRYTLTEYVHNPNPMPIPGVPPSAQP